MPQTEKIPQMTLGEFIRKLETANPKTPIHIDHEMIVPTHFDSYRGRYDQLALGFTTKPGAVKLAGEVLDNARGTISSTFAGWHGGEFDMAEDTPLWISNYGRASGVRIVGLDISEYGVTIMTHIDDNPSDPFL